MFGRDLKGFSIAGYTKRDMEYKEKAVDYILEQTGGWKNEMMLDKDMHDYALLYYFVMLNPNNLCGTYLRTLNPDKIVK